MLKSLKKLAILLSLLVALSYLGNLLIDNPYVHGVIRSTINEKLEKDTHVAIKFEAINVKFLPPRLDIYGIEIRQKIPDLSDKILAQIAHLQVGISPLALILSRTEMFDLQVNEPRLSLPLPKLEDLLKMDQFPDWNKPSQLQNWPLNIPMPLYHLGIANAILNIKIPSSHIESPDLLWAQLEGLSFDFNFHSWQDFAIKLQIKQANLSIDGAELIRNQAVQLSAKQDHEQLLSQNFHLESEELLADGQLRVFYETEARHLLGTLEDKNARQLKGLLINIDHKISKADIAILGRYLKVEQTAGKISGETQFQLHIPFDKRTTSWRVDGKGESEDALLYGFKLLNSRLDFSITEQGMTFEEVQVIKNKKELARGQGFIGFTQEVPYHFNIAAKSLPFNELMSILKTENFDAFSSDLTSSAISLHGTALPFSMQISGPARFDNVSLPFVKSLPKRFLDAPTCLIQTHIDINATALEITQGEAKCWMNSKAEAATENESTSSPLNLLGKFYFTNKEGIDLRISSSALDGQILNHFTKLPASGLLNIKTQIKGPYDRIDVNGDILAREFGLGGFYSNQLKGNFRLHLKDLSLEIPVLELGFVDQGSIELKQLQMDIAPPYKFSTSLKANKVPSNFLSQGLSETFNATSTAFELHHLQGNIAGNLLEPFAYRGKLNFSIQNLTFDHETLLSEASGKISGNEKNWSLENANIRLQKLEARIAMHIDHHSSKVLPKNFFHRLGILPNDHVHLSIKTLNQNLNSYRTNEISQEVNHLATLPYIGKFFREQKFGGQILLDADLEGPIDRLQGKIEGSLEQPYVWGIPISSFNISGFIDGWQLHIPELRHSGNALVGRLNIDFGKADMPYDWYFYMNQMDIRAIIGKIFAEDPRNFAYLSAEWTMAGRLTSFWSSQGEIAFNRIRSKIFRNLGSRTSSIELNSDDPIRIKITPQTWTMVEKKPLKLKGEYFDLSFTAGVNKLPDQLDIAVNGFVKLDILKNFSNIVETSRGEIVIDGSLRGSLSKPELSIHFRERRLDPFNLKEWQPLAIGLTDLGPSLNNIVMDVELRNEKIIVNKFKASKGREGSINIAGQLNFFDDDLDLSRLTIDLDRFEFNRLNVPVVKTADLTLTGKLLVTGNSLPLNLNGDITINRLQSIGNFDLRKQIVSSLYDSKINSNAGNGGGSDQAPYLNLDVAVKADKSVTVKNKSLEAVLSADLQVKGTDIKPLLKGQIVADRGTFNYRRNFKISQAVISFDEPVSPPNPRLDIIGETTVSPYKVTVIINGNLQTPKVQLTIDPPNRDDGSPISNLDILLLVSTGRIPEQANKTAEKASFNELVSFFAVFAEEPIEKLFDLSGQTVIREVYFDSYLSEAEQRPITRVNFPIRLGDKLNAVLQVDDEANTKVSLEYLIHEGITISGSLDKTSNKQSNVQNVLPADSGLDLKFRFGFD